MIDKMILIVKTDESGYTKAEIRKTSDFGSKTEEKEDGNNGRSNHYTGKFSEGGS